MTKSNAILKGDRGLTRRVDMTKQPAGPPMTFGNMRHLGVQNLVAFCLNDACRHQALIDVSSCPADTKVP
jgi:hypothetical protein